MSKKDKNAKKKPSGDLDEKEVGSLLAEAKKESLAGAQRRSSVISSDGVRLGTTEKVPSRRYDFMNPSVMSERKVERLSRMHTDMVSALEAQASLFLRSEVSMTFSSLKMLEYRKAIQGLEDPTHLALFRADPLPGVGLMEISPRLALSTVNQVLGGKGQPLKEDRDLTKIEADLIEEFLLVVVQEWCGQWQYETAPVASIIGHEVLPSALQICEPSTAMLQFTLDVTIRENTGRIQMIAPLFMVEPLIRYLESQSLMKVEATTAATRSPSWKKGYGEVPLNAEVSVTVGPMKVGAFNR